MALFAILAAGILTMWVPARWPLTVFELAILAGAAWRVGARWRRKQPVFGDAGIVLLFGIAAWGCLQWVAGWTVDAFRTQVEMLNWTVRAAAFLWAVDLDEAERNRFLTALVGFGAVLSVVAILTVFSSPPGVVFWSVDVGTGIATLGPFVYRNQYAAFAEVVLPVALYRALTRREQSWVYAGVSGILAASVVASGSRAGSLLCAAELGAVPLLLLARKRVSLRRAVSPIVAIGGAVAVLVAVVGWDFLWRRFEEANPLGLRWTLTQSTIDMLRARPWTGFGLGTWAAAYPAFARYDDGTFVNQAHNDWTQWGAEGGVAVLGAMLVFAGRLVRPALRWLPGLGAMAVLAHAMVDYPFQQRPALAVFFFGFFGLLRASYVSGRPYNPTRLTLSHT